MKWKKTETHGLKKKPHAAARRRSEKGQPSMPAVGRREGNASSRALGLTPILSLGGLRLRFVGTSDAENIKQNDCRSK